MLVAALARVARRHDNTGQTVRKMIKQTRYKSLFPKRLFPAPEALLAGLLLSAAIVPNASAHMMAPQHGSLNFKGDGVFMVLSLPISAFEKVDEGGDGKMSGEEFTTHRKAIATAIKEKVKLTDKAGERPLQGLLLSPVAAHNIPGTDTQHAEQLVVLGRFALADVMSANSDGLQFHVGLFGNKVAEQTLAITATRKSASDSKPQKYKFTLTPEQPKQLLFAE